MSDENVGGLVAKWRGLAETEVSRYSDPQNAHDATLKECADELEAALSAHGQPVVNEAALLKLVEEIRDEANTLAIDDGRGPLPLDYYVNRYAALTGATP